MALSPREEAEYVLDYGMDPDDLKPNVRAEYDKLKAERATQRIAGVVPVAPPPSPALEMAEADGLAVASLVLSLVWLGGLGSLLAVVFGAQSRQQARKDGKRPNAMAEAGLVIGWIGLVAAFLLIIAIGVAATHGSG